MVVVWRSTAWFPYSDVACMARQVSGTQTRDLRTHVPCQQSETAVMMGDFAFHACTSLASRQVSLRCDYRHGYPRPV